MKYSSRMATTWEQLAEQAMTLSSDSRARLADRLVESLDFEELGSIDKLWAAEAKRRRDEVRSGTVETLDGEVALRKVRDSLR
jgi:hypothetical protein